MAIQSTYKNTMVLHFLDKACLLEKINKKKIFWYCHSICPKQRKSWCFVIGLMPLEFQWYSTYPRNLMARKTMLYCYGIRTKNKSTYQPPSLLFHGAQQLGKLFEGLSWRRKIELLIHLHLLVKVQTYYNNLIHVGQ